MNGEQKEGDRDGGKKAAPARFSTVQIAIAGLAGALILVVLVLAISLLARAG